MIVKMKFLIATLMVFFGISYGIPLPESLVKLIEHSNDIATPCSSDISNAYVNVFLMIEVGTSMMATNLRQFSLNLQTALAKLNIGPFCGNHTSGISIIAYSDKAKLIANLSQIQNFNDLAEAISVETLKDGDLAGSDSAAGITNAFYMAQSLFDNYLDYSDCGDIFRNTIYMFVGSSMNDVDIDAFYKAVNFDVQSTFVTLNYNNNDPLLTGVFNNISKFHVYFMRHYPAFNFTAKDNLKNSLTDAITQTSCTCGTAYLQIVLFNQTSNRWTRYADCYLTFISEVSDASSACSANMEPPMIDAAVTSQEKHDFIAQTVDNSDSMFYIGLHRNAQKQWVWTDYDGSEFQLGSYAPWAPGFGADSPGDCVASFKQVNGTQTPWLWKPVPCDQAANKVFVCQIQAFYYFSV